MLKKIMNPFHQVAGLAHKRAVTLIEAVLFIVIALALIVGGIVFFNQASLAQRTTDTIRSVVGIQSETRGVFQSSASFGADGDDLIPTLIAAGAVPSSSINGAGDDLLNSWNGNVDIEAEGVGGEEFLVAFEEVPASACTRMISYDVSGNGIAGTGIESVFVNAADADGDADGAVTPAEAATACGTGDVTIEWTFSR